MSPFIRASVPGHWEAAESLLDALSEAEVQLPHLTKITMQDADFIMFDLEGLITEMENRRNNSGGPASRLPRKLSLINCEVTGTTIARMDITLREPHGEEEAMYGKGAYAHDD